MKLIRFTNPLGQQVGINPDLVQEVRPADAGNSNAKTVIVLTTGYQAVLEDVETVNARLGVE